VALCARCADEAPASQTLCDGCAERTASSGVSDDGDGAIVPRPLHEGAALPEPAPAAAANGIGRRELFAIVLAVVVGGGVTFALLTVAAARPSATTAPEALSVSARRTLAAAPGAALAAPQQTWRAGNPDWIGSERHTVAFELLAERKVQVWQRTAHPILVVRCMAKHTEAFVFIESAAQIEPQANRAVRIRIDNAAEREERWSDTEEHDALFAPDSTALAHQLIGATTLRFGYKPHNSAPVVAEFNVAGLGALIEPAAAQCGWKP
jgi:hypothetical protein